LVAVSIYSTCVGIVTRAVLHVPLVHEGLKLAE